MNSRNSPIYGKSISQTKPPVSAQGAKVVLTGKPFPFSLNDDILSKHTLLLGSTGCGKTTLFYHFVSQLRRQMTNSDVMIIFDSKGDFHSKFYDPLKDYVIGNSKKYAVASEHWNIYKEILADGWNEKDYTINAQEICRSFFEERTKNTSNAFFPNAARDLLATILTTFIREGIQNDEVKTKYFFNHMLRKFLDTADRQMIIDFLESHPEANSVISYISGENDQSGGVLAEMHTIIREILIGAFAEKGSFSMRQFVRDKGSKTLFIEYDLSIGNILTPIYRLLFDLALKEALGRNHSQGNVYLICDEFKLLPHLQHIDDGVNFGRSLGVKIFAGLQSIEQLYEIYGISRGKNIAAGFSSVYAFRANDISTREYISGRFGKNVVLEQYMNLQNKIVEDKRNGYMVEDWDINSLEVGEAIVGLPFSDPFKFYFAQYR